MNDTPRPDFVPYVPGPTNTGAFPPATPATPATGHLPPVSPAPWTTGQLPGQPPPTPGNSNRGLLTLIAALLGLIVLGGGAAAVWYFSGEKTPLEAIQQQASPSAAAYRVTGSLTLNDFYNFPNGNPCSGKGGYRDIGAGAQVTVSDASGATIATSQLKAGMVVDGKCVFTFEVENVPPGKNFYGIEVSHRGVLKYPEQEFVQSSLQLTLG